MVELFPSFWEAVILFSVSWCTMLEEVTPFLKQREVSFASRILGSHLECLVRHRRSWSLFVV